MEDRNVNFTELKVKQSKEPLLNILKTKDEDSAIIKGIVLCVFTYKKAVFKFMGIFRENDIVIN